MKKEEMMVVGAGQISLAIASRIGFGKKIILGDWNMQNGKKIAQVMIKVCFDLEVF